MLVHRKPVECFDADGQMIGAWKSMLEAAAENDGVPGFSKQTIKNCAGCK